MDQRSTSRIKLFRTLKVAFYCLGLPLFVLAVFITAWTMMGYAPFTEYNGGAFTFTNLYDVVISPAMTAVWVAFGVWALIAIVQLIVNTAMKNSRARTLVVAVTMLVVMLVPVFVMDAVFTAKINQIAADAPDGVTVDSYQSQLARYYPKSSDVDSIMIDFTKSYDNFTKVYNITGVGNMEASANNAADIPIYYDDLDIDINEDGIVDILDHKLVKVAPTNEKLVIKGKTYEGYRYVSFGQGVPTGYNSTSVTNPTRYVWYNANKKPTWTDGAFGYAVYNPNGTLADGYKYTVDVALEVMAQYYYAKEQLESRLGNSFDTVHEALILEAKEKQYEYYTSTEELERLWNESIKLEEGFSLTQGELNQLLNLLGSEVLGSNLIIDLLETAGGFLDLFSDILSSYLPAGFALDNIDVCALIDKLAGAGTAAGLTGFLNIEGLIIAIETQGQLSIVFKWVDDDGDVVTNIPVTIDEHILDNLEEVLRILLGDSTLNTVFSIVNLLGILPFELQADTISESIMGWLMDLLGGLYWYSSPIILPVYEFYVDKTDSKEDKEIAELFMMYDRAYYEGYLRGYMIGSRLIGDTLGDGSYDSSHGLTSYTAVKQLQIDISYKIKFYPYFNLRDKLLTMAPFAIFFMILSYVFAEKQRNLELGIEKPGEKKKKKKKQNGEADGNEADMPPNPAPQENAALNVSGNTVKEVL